MGDDDGDPRETSTEPDGPTDDTAATDSASDADGDSPTGSPPTPGDRLVDEAPDPPDEDFDEQEFWWRYGRRRERGEDVDADDALFGESYGRRRAEEPNPEERFRDPTGVNTGLSNISRAELREHYGPLRTFFKRRESWYRTFQLRLTQAWLRDTYDQYLTRTVRRMVGIVAAATALGLVLVAGLLGATRRGYISGPWLRGQVGVPVDTLAPALLGVFLATGLLLSGLYWLWHRVLRIRTRIARRRREINYNLPYAVTFIYALALAGVNFDRILVRLAESKSTYGAVSEEFDRVVRDTEMFGNNLFIGLANLGAVTPSAELERFSGDILTILETGGDLPSFLRDEVDAQLDTAVEEQEAFVEQLELVSEVFVIGFVAAPLFVLVVLIVVSFLGSDTVPVIAMLVYLIFPLGLVGVVLFVDVLSQPFRVTAADFAAGREQPSAPPESSDDPDWRRQYERDKRLRGLRNRVSGQLERVVDAPGRAFLFSVPVALALVGGLLYTGELTASPSALLSDPVGVTVGLAVAPLVVATTPVALIHEYRVRRNAVIERRFPDLLDLLAASNRRGLPLTRGLAILTEVAEGRVATELERLRNDIRWNFDTPVAFEAFGDRIDSPELTRTVKLIAEGSRVTSDLTTVLEVAADDSAERIGLKRDRRQTLQSYLAIVVIGFLVYLLVMLTLASSFLDPIEAFNAAEAASSDAPVALGSIPVDRLRVLLFHSALLQGFGSGVLAGKLAEDSLYSGLKYGLALVVVAVVAFVLF